MSAYVRVGVPLPFPVFLPAGADEVRWYGCEPIGGRLGLPLNMVMGVHNPKRWEDQVEDQMEAERPDGRKKTLLQGLVFSGDQ